MKITAKILIIIFLATLLTVITFSMSTIYLLKNNLKKNNEDTHELVYSFFIPTVSKYLWEFDLEGIKESVKSILQNHYSDSVSVFDSDGFLVISGNLSSKGEVEYQEKNETSPTLNLQELLDKDLTLEGESSFQIKNTSGENTEILKMTGTMYRKKKNNEAPTIIGAIEFRSNYLEIQKLINNVILIVLSVAFILTLILVVVIGLLLKKAFINRILKISDASVQVSMGHYIKIQEKFSKDEIGHLITNFNEMTVKIEETQERLKLLGEESLKISSCVTIETIASQFIESVHKISNLDIQSAFYISGSFLNLAKNKNYYKIDPVVGKTKMDEFIENGLESVHGENVQRFLIINNLTGNITAILELLYLTYSKSPTFLDTQHQLELAIQTIKLSASNALSTILFISEQKEQQRLVSEQETTRLVQNNLLPSSFLQKIHEFEIVGHFESAMECAGDWWTVYPLNNHKILLLLGDVTGHGTASALLTAVVKGFCDASYSDENLTPADLLTKLDHVVAQTSRGDEVMTMFAVILDGLTGGMTFSNAAHNFPILTTAKEDSIVMSKLVSHGKPLGYHTEEAGNIANRAQRKFINKMVTMNLGDLLFIYSDGLTEAINEQGEEFSDFRVKHILEKNLKESIETIKEKIISDFKEFLHDQKPADDVTFVLCRYHSKETKN